MRAVDTNVLVRLLARDDDEQVALAEAFVLHGAWVSHLVLAETMWVLESVYALSHADLIDAIEMLMSGEKVTLQKHEVVSAALGHYKESPSLRFTDCLILEIARDAGHQPLGTFDKKLAKVSDAQNLRHYER